MKAITSKNAQRLIKAGWKIGYKVTTHGGSYSLLKTSKSHVQYSTGRFSRPTSGSGPLCVFGSKRSMMDFLWFRGPGEDYCVVAYKPSSSTYAWGHGLERTELDRMPDVTKFADIVYVIGEV